VADVLGTFEQAVLLSLVRPKTALGKQAYGRAILKEVQLRLDREVSAGAVYATLDRLEQKNLISSEVREGDAARAGLPRRYYTIAPEGIRALNDAKAVVDRVWEGVHWPLKAATSR
jgi:DNA-binding PadR family transcriptional regulator